MIATGGGIRHWWQCAQRHHQTIDQAIEEAALIDRDDDLGRATRRQLARFVADGAATPADAKQLDLARRLDDTGQTDIDTICRTLGISRATLYRALKAPTIEPPAPS